MDWINLTGARKVHSLIDKVYKRKNSIQVLVQLRLESLQILSIHTSTAPVRLHRLQRELKEDNYQPQPVRQHPIQKRDKPGEYRMLGIPTIYDRVCQQALLNRLEPIFEPVFDDR